MILFIIFFISICVNTIWNAKVESSTNDSLMASIIKQLSSMDAKQVELQKEVADLKANITTLFGYHQNRPENRLDTRLECSTGWQNYSNHCYYFSSWSATWQEAKADCEVLNAYLVKIDNSFENDWIRARVRERYMDAWWIGLHDIQSNGNWTWVSDSTAARYTNFWTTKGSKNANCVEMWRYNYKWYPIDCDRIMGYICEKT